MAAIRVLRRSLTNRTLLGVCGGIGEYLHLDPVVVRVVWLLLTCASGVMPGIMLYLVFGLVIPETTT